MTGRDPAAPNIDFHAWNPVLARRSLALFQQIVVGEASTLDAWAHAWRQRMLALAAAQAPE
jgi:hypothetical protein